MEDERKISRWALWIVGAALILIAVVMLTPKAEEPEDVAVDSLRTVSENPDSALAVSLDMEVRRLFEIRDRGIGTMNSGQVLIVREMGGVDSLVVVFQDSLGLIDGWISQREGVRFFQWRGLKPMKLDIGDMESFLSYLEEGRTFFSDGEQYPGQRDKYTVIEAIEAKLEACCNGVNIVPRQRD